MLCCEIPILISTDSWGVSVTVRRNKTMEPIKYSVSSTCREANEEKRQSSVARLRIWQQTERHQAGFQDRSWKSKRKSPVSTCPRQQEATITQLRHPGCHADTHDAFTVKDFQYCPAPVIDSGSPHWPRWYSDSLTPQWRTDVLISHYWLLLKLSPKGRGGIIRVVQTVSSQTCCCWESTVLTDRILASKMRLDN